MALIAAPARAAVPTIAATWSEDVVRTEATLKAEVNPEGLVTTYHFEWGTTTAYGSQTAELPVGSDGSVHKVTRFLSGLQPGTTYHYRVVATNGDGAKPGADRTFTTHTTFVPDTNCPNQEFRFGPAVNLADCRAYEMVSPVDKNGGEIITGTGFETGRAAFNQSALDGEKMTYTSLASFGDSPSASFYSQYIASRGADGWSTHGISAPQGLTLGDPIFLLEELEQTFQAFTPDLSHAWLRNYNKTPLTPDANAGYLNLFKRDNSDDSFEALTIDPPLGPTEEFEGRLGIRGYSSDLSHQVFTTQATLTPDAPLDKDLKAYDFTGGQLELVSVLPDETPAPENASPGSLGASFKRAALDHAVSDDGSRIFWTTAPGSFAWGTVYVRIDGETTVQVSKGSDDLFLTASTDGSKALLLESAHGHLTAASDLYEVDVDAETATPIAEDSYGILGASDDLSYVYFVSLKALAPGATAGEANVYLYREGDYTFIATVDKALDAEGGEVANGDGYAIADFEPFMRAARVVNDGRHVAFQSVRSLTGYDNTDLNTGKPAVEVYVYDADADELTCVSCNPSGARPSAQPLRQAYTATDRIGELKTHQAAAWLPTFPWSLNETQPLSEDGNRLFFNAFDPLVPADANGVQDVYQWEAQGSGTCQKAGGCLSLISTGQGRERSEFVDASADGATIFFESSSSILPQDPTGYDIYAARVNGGYPAPAPPAPCVGDSCQSIPGPPNDPTPASASFKGAGDPQPKKRRPRCRARVRKGAKGAKSQLKRKQAKRCKRAKRGAGR